MADAKKTAVKTMKASKEDTLQTHGAAFHLELSVPKGKHVIVELAAPLNTISYDQGTVEDGKLDLKFPVPDEEGDVMLRVVTVDDDKNGERKLVHSQIL